MGYKGVIKRVDQPTDWVNSLVTADKAASICKQYQMSFLHTVFESDRKKTKIR